MITQDTIDQMRKLLDDMQDDTRRYKRQEKDLQETEYTDKRWVYNTDAKPLEDILRSLQFGRGVRDVALLERWAQALETHSIDTSVLIDPSTREYVLPGQELLESEKLRRARVGGTPEGEVTSTPPPVDSPTPPNDWGADDGKNGTLGGS